MLSRTLDKKQHLYIGANNVRVLLYWLVYSENKFNEHSYVLVSPSLHASSTNLSKTSLLLWNLYPTGADRQYELNAMGK